EVAGPEAGAGFAVAVDDELDGAVDAVEFLFQMLLFKIGGDAALTNRDALHINIDLRWIECHAGIPGSGNDAPPVRVGTTNRGLHQRRVRDAPRDPFG